MANSNQNKEQSSNQNKEQSSAEINLHAEVKVEYTFKRSLTRKNPQTGKSDYPTLRKNVTNRNYYYNGKKINNSNYRQNNDKTSK